MSNVVFEETFKRQATQPVDKTPFFVKLLIRMDIVDNEKQANVVLVIIAVLFLMVAGFFFFRTFSFGSPSDDVRVPAEPYLNS